MGVLLALLSVIMQIAPHGGPNSPPPPLSVCEVLANPLRFNGKQIDVRGYVTSTGEGTWLNGDCKAHLVTDGFVWPDSIWITLFPDPIEPLHEKTFATDMRALHELSERTAEIVRLHGKECRFWITYEGLLETQPDLHLETVLDIDGKRRAAGFGHLAGAAAQLVVKTVRDLRVEYAQQPKSKSETGK